MPGTPRHKPENPRKPRPTPRPQTPSRVIHAHDEHPSRAMLLSDTTRSKTKICPVSRIEYYNIWTNGHTRSWPRIRGQLRMYRIRRGNETRRDRKRESPRKRCRPESRTETAKYTRSRGGEHGVTSVETALMISSLLVVAGLVINIVMTVYEKDQMGRSAYAVAQALALGSQVPPCDIVRHELDRGPHFECKGEWAITVSRGVKPSEILTGVQSGTGDMVVVRIGAQGSASTGIARAEPGE